jgi:formate hydrogenlyase subunit 3/multisubunit Na+/H+ antiporter MnhD subunit
MWIWVFGLSILKQRKATLDFRNTGGDLWGLPFTGIAVLLAHFTLTGLPLLAGFILRLTLFTRLAEVSILSTAWAFIGNIGFAISGFRSLAMLVNKSEETRSTSLSEKTGEAVFLVLGILVLVLMGWFPQIFLPGMLNLTRGF